MTRRFWWAAGGLVLLATLSRLPALAYPHGIDDEWVYAVVANEMVHGGQPYVDAVERKPPLLFLVYAAVFQLFGSYNFLALHVVGLAWTLGTMGSLFLAGRRLWSPREGFVAAALYGIYVSWGHWKNLAFNGEMLMNLPVACALWLVVRRGSGRQLELFGAGLLVAAAFLLKQPGAIAGAAFGLFVLLPSYRRRDALSLAGGAAHASSLAAGFGTGLAVAAAALFWQGLLDEALYWTVFDHDLPHGPLDPVFWFRALMTIVFVAACYPLVLGAMAATARRRQIFAGREPEGVLLLLFTIVSFVGTASSGRFYLHYYIQMVPALALLAAPVIASAMAGEERGRWRRPRMAAAHLALAVLVFFSLHVYGIARWAPVSETAAYLRIHAEPDDRVFVWGQAAYIYAQANRRPATRYIATFPLTGYVFGSPVSDDPSVDTSDRILPGSWAGFEEDVARRPPDYIVLHREGRTRYPVETYPALARLLADYRPVFHGDDGDVWRRKGTFGR